jgi:hypothetical protein
MIRVDGGPATAPIGGAAAMPSRRGGGGAGLGRASGGDSDEMREAALTRTRRSAAGRVDSERAAAGRECVRVVQVGGMAALTRMTGTILVTRRSRE